MKPFLLLALLCTFSLLSYPKEIYVDQSTSSPSNEQDGSKYSPFSSLEAAFKAITFGTFDIVFLGQSYTVSQQESFTTEDAINEIIITITAEEGFTLKYSEQGQIWCTNFQQNIITPLIKNVNISFIGLNIETQSTIPLFYGDCYFTFKDILIDELRSTLFTAKSEGSALLQNFTINNIVLGADQSLIDQNSLERIQGDYLILDSVTMKNTATNSALIKSYLQYKKIEVKDSDLEGISFGIIGEEIGGNNKTNITVQNVAMRNALNFFMIDSYGILVVENSTFTNATNRAFFFFLADENLSPILATFKNCIFEDNIVQFAGGAITFQGSSETSYQFSLNTIITGCKFTNNQASFSGGALALLYLENVNVTISNSEFISNLGTESGGAIYANGGESTFSMMIKNTTFISNSAFSGGVFSFEFMNYSTIILDSNLYANNSAKFEGGIGVVSESVITLTDTNSIATGNSAGFQGGAWSFDSDSTDNDSDVKFQEVLFGNNRAFLKGGCISNNGVSLWLNRVSFENCSLVAVSSLGGAIYIGEDATVTVTNSQFINNQAELGAAIAIQSLKEKPMILDGITLQSNLSKLGNDAPTVKSQIILGPGEFVLKNLTVPNLQSPFLSQQSGKIGLQNVRLGTIKCHATDASLSFCIFGIQADEEDAQSIVIEDLYVESADSSIPLLISQGSTVSLNSIMVNETKLSANVPMWEIRNSALKASKVELMDFNNKFILVTDSDIELEDSNFVCKPEGLKEEDDSEDTSDTHDLDGKYVLVSNTTNNMNNTQ